MLSCLCSVEGGRGVGEGVKDDDDSRPARYRSAHAIACLPQASQGVTAELESHAEPSQRSPNAASDSQDEAESLAAGDAANAPALVRHQRITAHLLAVSGAVAAPLAAHLDDARSSPPLLAAAHARACRRRQRRGRPGQRTPPAFGARARRHAPGGAAKKPARGYVLMWAGRRV